MAQDIWVLLEAEDNSIKEASLEVLSEARKIARAMRNSLTVLSTVGNEEVQKTVKSFGTDILYLPSPKASLPGGAAIAELLVDMIKLNKPAVVMAAETIFGHEVLALVSAELKLPFLPDCVGLEKDQTGKLKVERYWCYDRVSAIMAGKCDTTLVSIRPGLFNVKKELSSSSPLIKKLEECSVNEAGVRILEFIKADPRTVDISDAEIIVSGGRGIETAENFQMLLELADLIGAAIAGTRIARDNGWIPLERQIGQTGKTVAPKLIISCGISGAMQHTFGMKEAKNIVVINKDKNAPIFKMADVSVVGDVKEVIPSLIKEIKKLRGVNQK